MHVGGLWPACVEQARPRARLQAENGKGTAGPVEHWFCWVWVGPGVRVELGFGLVLGSGLGRVG